jgi:opacity protein-like surface antigen
MTGSRHLAAAALAAALLLALPATAHAQARARSNAAAPAKAPAPPPAKAPAPPPAVAPAPEPEPSDPGPLAAPITEDGPWRSAVALGYEKDSDADLAGTHLQVGLERDLVPLGSRGQLSFVASVAWLHATDSKSTPIPMTTASVKADTTLDVFELVPAFRAGFALVPRLRFYAEVGVGGGWTTGSVKTTAPGVATTVSSDAFLGVLRLTAGGTFALNERLRVGVELPTLVRRYGETQSQTLSFSATAAYAF